MSILLGFSVASSTILLLTALLLARGVKQLEMLGNVQPENDDVKLKVSIIVPACNEEAHLETALLSLLAQEYENLQIIVVNDRSTDGTGVILSGLAKRFPRLVVHEVERLPDGWMGKSHALATGAGLASGDLLLFTDADIIMEKTAVARAVSYMVSRDVDHLSVLFKNISSGWLLNSLILDMGMGLLLLFRPWAVSDPKSSAFIGVGAFNMVRKDVYRAIGGHRQIRMHPVDDLMLGKLIKQQGFSQHCLFGHDFICVPWYDSVGAMVGGLMKNVFSLIHYRLSLVMLPLLIIILLHVLPVWGVMFGTGKVFAVCCTGLAIRLLIFSKGLALLQLPAAYAPAALVTPYISCYIIVRSAVVSCLNGGIVWRGQLYRLEQLRKAGRLLF